MKTEIKFTEVKGKTCPKRDNPEAVLVCPWEGCCKWNGSYDKCTPEDRGIQAISLLRLLFRNYRKSAEETFRKRNHKIRILAQRFEACNRRRKLIMKGMKVTIDELKEKNAELKHENNALRVENDILAMENRVSGEKIEILKQQAGVHEETFFHAYEAK